jgi:hypothetical protein
MSSFLNFHAIHLIGTRGRQTEHLQFHFMQSILHTKASDVVGKGI